MPLNIARLALVQIRKQTSPDLFQTYTGIFLTKGWGLLGCFNTNAVSSMGLEPILTPWKGGILPLDEEDFMCLSVQVRDKFLFY